MAFRGSDRKFDILIDIVNEVIKNHREDALACILERYGRDIAKQYYIDDHIFSLIESYDKKEYEPCIKLVYEEIYRVKPTSEEEKAQKLFVNVESKLKKWGKEIEPRRKFSWEYNLLIHGVLTAGTITLGAIGYYVWDSISDKKLIDRFRNL